MHNVRPWGNAIARPGDYNHAFPSAWRCYHHDPSRTVHDEYGIESDSLSDRTIAAKCESSIDPKFSPLTPYSQTSETQVPSLILSCRLLIRPDAASLARSTAIRLRDFIRQITIFLHRERRSSTPGTSAQGGPDTKCRTKQFVARADLAEEPRDVCVRIASRRWVLAGELSDEGQKMLDMVRSASEGARW